MEPEDFRKVRDLIEEKVKAYLGNWELSEW